VLFLKWEPLTVFACYAFETIVVGIFNIFKLFVVYFSGNQQLEEANPNAMGFFAIPGFVFSYGLLVYCQMHMFFMFIVFVKTGDERIVLSLRDSIALLMDDHSVFLTFSVLFVSNAGIFINDFIFNKEYTRRSMREQMTEPFPMVMGSQFVVLIGAYLYAAFGHSILLLLSLTTIKVITELLLKRHKSYEIFA